jgi:hypothetical protein
MQFVIKQKCSRQKHSVLIPNINKMAILVHLKLYRVKANIMRQLMMKKIVHRTSKYKKTLQKYLIRQ